MVFTQRPPESLKPVVQLAYFLAALIFEPPVAADQEQRPRTVVFRNRLVSGNYHGRALLFSTGARDHGGKYHYRDNDDVRITRSPHRTPFCPPALSAVTHYNRGAGQTSGVK
jgi:hypothetical protein